MKLKTKHVGEPWWTSWTIKSNCTNCDYIQEYFSDGLIIGCCPACGSLSLEIIPARFKLVKAKEYLFNIIPVIDKKVILAYETKIPDDNSSSKV